jgi:hypothetical protein
MSAEAGEADEQNEPNKIINFPQALNKQKTITSNRMSPPCTRARDDRTQAVVYEEPCFRTLAYDGGAGKGKKRAANSMVAQVDDNNDADSVCAKRVRVENSDELLEMGLKLIRAITLETDIDNSTDVTKSVMKIMQAFSGADNAKKRGGGGDSSEEQDAECKNINPKALANAVYYMVDVLFGRCENESVTRLIMIFIDAVRTRMRESGPDCVTNAELDKLASSLFIYIATNRASMQAMVAR